MELRHFVCFMVAALPILCKCLAEEPQGLEDNLNHKLEPDFQTPKDVSSMEESIIEEEKRWPHFPSWGKKQGWMKKWNALNTWGKRRWNNQFATWGKRGWNHQSFATWGKRPDWKFATWGKRGWNNKQFATWGKRSDQSTDSPAEEALLDEPDKKAWTQFATWGKRDRSDNVGSQRWNNFAAWGKRNEDGDQPDVTSSTTDAQNDSTATDEKRWNMMSTWGKRFPDSDSKRWSNFPTWGKREVLDVDKKWNNMAVWGKRERNGKWGLMPTWGKRGKQWNVMSAWGKRNGDDLEQSEHFQSTNNFLFRFFDKDDDGVLDNIEFDNLLAFLAGEHDQELSELRQKP